MRDGVRIIQVHCIQAHFLLAQVPNRLRPELAGPEVGDPWVRVCPDMPRLQIRSLVRAYTGSNLNA